jgi:hypothetical protein
VRSMYDLYHGSKKFIFTSFFHLFIIKSLVVGNIIFIFWTVKFSSTFQMPRYLIMQ